MARQFTAANSEALTTATTPITGYPLTMACWFKSNDVTGTYCIMWLGDQAVTNHWFSLEVRGAVGGDPLSFRARGTGSTYADSSIGYTANVWHHACAVGVSATDRTVYLDGGNTGTNVVSSTPANVDGISVGALNDLSPGLFFDGAVAEAALWSAALTAAELAVLAAGYSPLAVRPGSLVFYAPLIHGVTASGGNDTDIVGGLTLADTNTVTVADHPRIIRSSRQIWTPGTAAAAPSGNPWYYYQQQAIAGAA